MEKERRTYRIPEPTVDPISALVILVKVLRGVQYDDRPWDKVHFPRYTKSAKILLDICGSFAQAKRCIEDLVQEYDSKDITWTIETVTRHAHEWKRRNERRGNDKQVRQRFFADLARQRANSSVAQDGKSEEGTRAVGDSDYFSEAECVQEGRGDSADGKPGNGLGKIPLEIQKP